MPGNTTDWKPELYARFRGLRLRPAIDLLDRVGGLPEGDVVDLCCGAGSVGEALSARFAGRRIIGVDTSPAMLTDAGATGSYSALVRADAADWAPEAAPALIFSNAALHWLPAHGALMPRLAGLLAPGGILAVQMPRQFSAPSHRLLRDYAQDMFPDRFDFINWKPAVLAPVEYHRMLAPLGEVDVWETDYVQRLDPVPEGHPVRSFTEATAMRPITGTLTAGELEAFTRRYETGLGAAYPVEEDGSVLLPFRRLFFTLRIATRTA